MNSFRRFRRFRRLRRFHRFRRLRLEHPRLKLAPFDELDEVDKRGFSRDVRGGDFGQATRVHAEISSDEKRAFGVGDDGNAVRFVFDSIENDVHVFRHGRVRAELPPTLGDVFVNAENQNDRGAAPELAQKLGEIDACVGDFQKTNRIDEHELLGTNQINERVDFSNAPFGRLDRGNEARH